MSLILSKLKPLASLATRTRVGGARLAAFRQLSSIASMRPTGLASWRPVLSSARSLLRAKPIAVQRSFATDSAAAGAGATAEPAAAGAAGAANGTATPGAAGAAGATDAAAEKDKQIAELKKKIEANEKTLKETKDELLRAYAEMQNVRRIAKSDVQSANLFALTGIGKRLVEVLDNLQRATASAQNAGLFDANGKPQALTDVAAAEQLLRSLLEGVSLTEKVFLKALNDHGFKRFGADTLIGAKLDPNAHNVLFSFEDATKTPNTVAQVLKDGYTLHERVLRPADVATIKPPPKPAATAAPAS